jgi:hypothetical protein
MCQQLYVKLFARLQINYDLRFPFGIPLGILFKLDVNHQYETLVYEVAFENLFGHSEVL